MLQTLDKSQLPLFGYKLLDLGSTFELRYVKGVFKGSFAKVCTFAIVELGFDLKEIEDGVIEMNKMGHDGIEFGILKRFVFTFKQKESYDKRTTVH